MTFRNSSRKSFLVVAMLGVAAGAALAQTDPDNQSNNAACASVTSDGKGIPGRVAVFTTACNIETPGKAGIGTSTPHSPFEVRGQIGTTNVNSVTITNTGIAGATGVAAVAFNTYNVPSTAYNPSGRFAATDDGQFGNGFSWQSNLPATHGGGGPDLGLYTLMTLNSLGTTSGGNSLVITQGIGSAISDGWITYSSRAFKTNIQTLDGALEKVEQLRGVSYDRKDNGRHEIGVVAEEVAQVVPEVVARDPQTQQVRGVDYTRLTALLIEAVKQQQTTIQDLQSQVNMLKGAVAR